MIGAACSKEVGDWTEANMQFARYALRSPLIRAPLPSREGQKTIKIQGVGGWKRRGAHRELEARSLLYLEVRTSLSSTRKTPPFPCFFSIFNLYTNHSQALVVGSSCC